MRKQGPARFLPATLLFLALIPFTWVALHFSDLPQFGKYQDDGLFLIAAKSLHDSGAYRISSLPGRPFQTKYQPLYPLLLSGVWLFDGKFPENLKTVSVLEWGIVIACFVATYLLCRALGFSRWKSAAMSAFLAISPWLVYWALVPVSDFLFWLLVSATFWVLYRHRGDPRWWWVAGCLGAMAYLTKVVGILLVPAIWLGSWRHKDWKRGFIMTAPIIAACVGWTVWAQLHRTPQQNSIMWYYTDYIAFHLNNGGLAALSDIIQANVLSLISVVGNSVLYNLADSTPGRFASVILIAAAIAGTRRLVRRTRAVEYPAFCAMVIVLLLIWNFSPNVRLMAPVMPLVAIGLWEEGAHFFAVIRKSLGSEKASSRAAAHAIRVAMLAGCSAAAALNVHFVLKGIPALLEHDRATLTNTRVVFGWCKRNLPSSSVILTDNDTFLYLYTGLSALRPVPNSVAFYKHDEPREIENFIHLDHLADAFGVTHIVITAESFTDFESRQRELIVRTLLSNPRNKKVYSANGATVLEVEPGEAHPGISRIGFFSILPRKFLLSINRVKTL